MEELEHPDSIKEGGLGLRELQAFNMTLLTKMAWGAMQNPYAFGVKTLKCIYYRAGELAPTRRGTRVSWAWSIILAGQDIIANEGLWIIRNGENVRVFDDA